MGMQDLTNLNWFFQSCNNTLVILIFQVLSGQVNMLLQRGYFAGLANGFFVVWISIDLFGKLQRK